MHLEVIWPGIASQYPSSDSLNKESVWRSRYRPTKPVVSNESATNDVRDGMARTQYFRTGNSTSPTPCTVLASIIDSTLVAG